MADTISTSGAIRFTGLGNGTDFDSMITSLIEVEEQRITSLETWKSSWENKITGFQELNTAMLTLKTTLEGMDSMGEFLTKAVASSDTTVATATAGADALEETHTITVNKLAQNKIMVTSTGYSLTEDINASNAATTFKYDYQGTTYSVDVPAACTLGDLAAIINAAGDNPGVKATIVNDGTSNYLQLRGMDTGAESTLTIASNSGLSNFTDSDFEVTQANQDAELKLDGWPVSTYLTRSTNSISDLVDGLTINIKSTGTTQLTATTDTDAVKETIETFVEQMNTVRQYIQALTEVDTTSNEGSILTGNYGVQIIDSNLKNIFASKGIGFDYSLDDYVTLAQLGITTDATEGSVTQGLLVIDDETLDAALADDPYGVALLFSAKDVGSTDTTDFKYYSSISTVTDPGEYDVQYTVSGGQVVSATINGNEAKASGTSITGLGGNPEAGLVLNVVNLTDGVYSGKVFLKQGKTGEFIDQLEELTSETSGPLHILEENYDDIIASIDEKIDYEERRIALKESRLRERFARLDATLGTYDNLQTQLESQIAQLSD